VLVEGPTCHPFDEDGNKGFLRAEGLGCVVLRRQPDAEAQGNRILCLIRKAIAASAGAADSALEGPGRVYEQPCPYGMRQMWTTAYDMADLSLSRLSYLECHATGTAVGDIIEVEVRRRRWMVVVCVCRFHSTN
jgi:acyl transferase domain-containing protein